MKPHLVIAICAMLLVGCAKSGPLSTSDMEDLFLHSYTNSVKPVTMSPLDNEGLEDLLAKIYLNDNEFFTVLYPKLPDSPMTVSVLVKEDN